MFERIKTSRPWLRPSVHEIAILPGWDDLVSTMLDEIGQEMAKYPDARLTIKQIKEKFGALRFYYRLEKAPELLGKAIAAISSLAEKRSYLTCEECGEAGQLREDVDGEWYWVRCDRHAPADSKIVKTNS